MHRTQYNKWSLQFFLLLSVLEKSKEHRKNAFNYWRKKYTEGNNIVVIWSQSIGKWNSNTHTHTKKSCIENRFQVCAICPKELFENLYARTERKKTNRFQIEMLAAAIATGSRRNNRSNNNSNAISYTVIVSLQAFRFSPRFNSTFFLALDPFYWFDFLFGIPVTQFLIVPVFMGLQWCK